MPFKSSPALLDQYIFVDGRIRTGKLLEGKQDMSFYFVFMLLKNLSRSTPLDLDALAGAIAYKHIDNYDPDSAPVTIVTACVDRLDLLLPEAVEDYKLTGHITFVGTSSMEGRKKFYVFLSLFSALVFPCSPGIRISFILPEIPNSCLLFS